jgi:F0F1-type ATP synthase assembly protein I
MPDPTSNPGPTPRPSTDGKQSAAVASYVQAEKLLQIAFVLPCAMLIGWGAGWWIDRHFHTRWASILGLVLGITAGMVSAIRMALDAGKPAKGAR